MERTCEAVGCVNAFEAKRSTARFCSATCRQRAGRQRRAAEGDEVVVERSDSVEHGLVVAVRRDLKAADALDSVAGQLALQLAKRIANPDESGVSTLSKELRSLLAEAKGLPAGGEPEPATDDEVESMRRRRVEKAAQAAAQQ